MKQKKHKLTLSEKYPSSEPCSCEVCTSYCQRPGWWTVEEAEKVIEAGFADRMMLEISPEQNFAVLSPAFKGNECNYASHIYSKQACTFLQNGLCELYDRSLQPLECKYCHHNRKGLGIKCHLDIEKEWKTNDAKRLVVKWGNIVGFWQRQGLILKEK
jgi:hypothetical protein